MHDGDSIVSIIYRNKSHDQGATPLSQFDYKNYPLNKTWVDLITLAG